MLRAVDILRKKRDGEALSRAEIELFVSGVTSRAWPEYQTTALLMAIVLRGMNADETAWLTSAMVHSGVRLNWNEFSQPKVDKHSTGGVGDKTSLILAPLVAACGFVVPMMSGRGLGHTGGTLDKLEAIPGFRVGLSLHELRLALHQTGCALIGQTAEVAPADKILYALRDVTATVESIPLISASIMSKKIAEGIDALVMDVKFGRGAFMQTQPEARRLAESLVSIGRANGVRTRALLTAMSAPLGRAIGNALEVKECVQVLRKEGPTDLTELSIVLAAHMLHLGSGKMSFPEARQRIEQALQSGAGLAKFREIIAQQGGEPRIVDDPSLLPTAPKQYLLKAKQAGHVTTLAADLIGRAGMILGAGREKAEDRVDPAVGLVLHATVGQEVRVGETLAELHYRDEARLASALELVEQAYQLGEPPIPEPLVADIFGD